MTCAKYLLIGAIFSMITASPSYAEFSIPSHVYTVDQIEEAKDIAKATAKALTFVYTNKDTKCGLATSASLDAFKELQKETIIIYACSGNDQTRSQIHSLVRRAINSPQSGQYIPKTVIVDSKITKVIAIIPYTRDPNRRKQLFNEANNIISSQSY